MCVGGPQLNSFILFCQQALLQCLTLLGAGDLKKMKREFLFLKGLKLSGGDLYYLMKYM